MNSGSKSGRTVLWALGLVFGLGAASAHAENQQALAVDYLQGEGDVQGIKLAYQYRVTNPTWVPEQVELWLESSANFWRYGPHNSSDRNLVVAASPVLRWSLGRVWDLDWQGEFGIGVSFLDDTYFAGKNVSTHYQFEDRLGLMVWISDHESLSLRYLHYSNAGLKHPNPGLDFVSLSYGYYF
ncbi:acyloxyacyl hydrolase [Rheinheimera marina]|uniref:Lipid A deacylase n=1 Tax=Rheinheimera marina TaxID=1774958 RepID=A0ABV9JP82_9GAMM